MGERTGIAWCDATVNFWWGCQEVSPGCDHCYARTIAAKFRGMTWGPGSERQRIASAHALAVKVNATAKREGRRLRVFTNSMSDFFDNAAPNGERAAAWATIRTCEAVDWLILTKRPQNIRAMLPDDWGDGWPHVWLGVSAENQAEADRRIPLLRDIPAAVKWVSFEPLLSGIRFRPPWRTHVGLAWAVIGGESGTGRRDCGVDAIEMLALRCRGEGLVVFIKQDSAAKPGQQGRLSADLWAMKARPGEGGTRP